MIFHTASQTKRPIRLCRKTREWAWSVMHGEYGDDAVKNNCITLDCINNFNTFSAVQKYDTAIREIASRAPVRVCDQEEICGSATLGMAITHNVPATYNGETVFSSVSHLTVRYDKVIFEGLDSYKADIELKLSDNMLTKEQKEVLRSFKNVIDSIRIWHDRYKEAVKISKPEIYDMLIQVPFSPARNFREAVQSLWFIFSFIRLCGNWPGIGRIDWLLGDYLKKDLASNRLDRKQAREILASFFIKGCEWIQSDTPCGTGDSQHYQNIVLAGLDAEGNEVTNDVTYLVLDIIEELGISDFPVTLRLNRKSPERLLRKAAQVIRHGGGVIAIYNEELVLRAFHNEGYEDSEARTFANDGCWEVQIPGKTCFSYVPFDALHVFNNIIGINSTENIPDFKDAETIYGIFREELEKIVRNIYKNSIADNYIFEKGRWGKRGDVLPSAVISLFEEGSIDNAAFYHDLGTKYTVISPHIGGAPDVANSIYALQKAVFSEGKVSFSEMINILRSNWEENEPLRLYMKNKYIYYGNDFDEADNWMARILNDFADIVKAVEKENNYPVKFIPGVSTFGRQIEWIPNRSATAFGYRKGDILSGNGSPTPGTDSSGATSIIRSYCKANLEKQSSGAALDIKIFPESLKGENGICALKELMKGVVRLNGFFVQLDTVDAGTLRKAKENPEGFKTLSVRVSGWNARFVTLDEEWQNMIIERTSQEV